MSKKRKKRHLARCVDLKSKSKRRHLARCVDLKGKRRKSKRGHLARCVDVKNKRKGSHLARCLDVKRRRKNPWSSKDVKRHNKKCAAKAKCRKKWPKIANAVLRKTGDEGRAIRIANWQTGKLKLNPDPQDIDPEKLEETASSMAWTLNDELWDTAPEHRKQSWREIARETVQAMMLPSKQKKRMLDKVSKKIQLLQEGESSRNSRRKKTRRRY